MGGEEESPIGDEDIEAMGEPKVQIAVLNAPWWALVLQGIIVLVLGVLARAYPDLTLKVFLMLFGTLVLVQGIFAIIGSIAVKAEDPMWALLLMGGIVSAIIGSVALFWPDLTAVILLWLIGLWAFIAGTVMLVYALKVRKHEVAGKNVQVVLGLIGVGFGLVAFIWPEETAMTLVTIVGIFMVIFGLLFVAVGLMVKGKQ